MCTHWWIPFFSLYFAFMHCFPSKPTVAINETTYEHIITIINRTMDVSVFPLAVVPSHSVIVNSKCMDGYGLINGECRQEYT